MAPSGDSERLSSGSAGLPAALEQWAAVPAGPNHALVSDFAGSMGHRLLRGDVAGFGVCGLVLPPRRHGLFACQFVCVLRRPKPGTALALHVLDAAVLHAAARV